jgi:ABC transporter
MILRLPGSIASGMPGAWKSNKACENKTISCYGRALSRCGAAVAQCRLCGRESSSLTKCHEPCSPLPAWKATLRNGCHGIPSTTCVYRPRLDQGLPYGRDRGAGPARRKSTLLNILGGLDVPSSGEAYWRDQSLVNADEAALTRYRRAHVGFVFQFYNLIPSLTACENVALVTDMVSDPMSPEDALTLVGLGASARALPGTALGR